MRQPQPRYALYYLPENGSALDRLGSALLGRSARTGRARKQPAFAGFSPEDLFALTRDARRYGLHATLKPPFFLAPGTEERDLLRAAERFARNREPLPLPPLEVDRIGSFFALTMRPGDVRGAMRVAKIHRLAEDAVIFFDDFRAPSSEEDLARRRERGLTPIQEKYLAAWGYPYVFTEFRFHITLTDAVQNQHTALLLENALQNYLRHALSGNTLTSLGVFRSNVKGDFTLFREFLFEKASQSF